MNNRGFQSNSAKPKVFCGFRSFVNIWIVDMWITLHTPLPKRPDFYDIFGHSLLKP